MLALSGVVAAREGNWDEATVLIESSKQRAGGLWADGLALHRLSARRRTELASDDSEQSCIRTSKIEIEGDSRQAC